MTLSAEALAGIMGQLHASLEEVDPEAAHVLTRTTTPTPPATPKMESQCDLDNDFEMDEADDARIRRVLEHYLSPAVRRRVFGKSPPKAAKHAGVRKRFAKKPSSPAAQTV